MKRGPSERTHGLNAATSWPRRADTSGLRLGVGPVGLRTGSGGPAQPAQTAAPPPTAAPQVARAEAAPAPATTTSPKPQATAEPTPTAEATPAAPAFAEAFQGIRGIVDPTNFGWPREVEGLNGIVSIPFKPLRIITASVGHDEMTLAIVPLDRLVAVGGASKDQTYSNVADLLRTRPRSPATRRPSFPRHRTLSSPVRFSQRMGSSPCPRLAFP